MNIYGLHHLAVYYPRFGLPDFVVRAEKVEAALRTPWSAGMRVKMAVEADELQRKTWFQGTIMVVNGGPRCKTPWRMLQVTWDEPESRMLNVNGVNPWQVEQVKPTSLFDTFFQPNKRLRLPQHLMNHTPSCADMQGARWSRILSSGDELPLKRTEPDVATKVPTLVAYSNNVSTGTSSVQFCGTSQPGRTSSSTKDGRPTSFQLFGKVIQVSKS